MSEYYGDLTNAYGPWAKRVDLKDERAVLFYADGSARFRHHCDRGDRGTVICAPLLQMGHGHSIVQEDPLIIVASVLCPDCGTHGFVTDGEWRPC